MVGIDHEVSAPTFNMFFYAQPSLLLFLLCSIFQAITFFLKSTKLPQISSALPRYKIARSEGLLPPTGAVLHTQEPHEPNELFPRCPHNRLHRDQCGCYPLESSPSLTLTVTVYGRCSSGRFHRYACQIEEEGCFLPC